MKQTDTVLDKIVAAKRQQLEAQKAKLPLAELKDRLAGLAPFKGLGFFEALKAKSPKPKIIAEAKKASPSKGVLRRDFALEDINRAYQESPGVAAISVITEADHFQGSHQSLEFFAAHNTNQKPLLRKDFIFDPYQVFESKLLGAQAFLLLASLLDKAELDELVNLGLELGIEPFVEAHDEAELALALSTKARVIGVNSRDLKTFKVDVKAHELLRGVDEAYAKVAESGIETADYLNYLSGFADAGLVGSHLMAAGDIKAAIAKLTSGESK